uniref:Uncharacterized protein n=1 Tax=Glossina austeni TaxID=7395 RepID=A0A1A9UTB7_GLOAU
MSPVSKLKHAPCQGQRIRPSPKTPFANGTYTAMILCNLIIANDSKFVINTIDGRIGDVTAYICTRSYGKYASFEIKTRRPAYPCWRKVSTHIPPAGPPPTTTNVLGSFKSRLTISLTRLSKPTSLSLAIMPT